MRVYELARTLGVSSRALVEQLRSEGEWVTSHMSGVPEPRVRMLIGRLKEQGRDLSLAPAQDEEQSTNSPTVPNRPQGSGPLLPTGLPRRFWRRRPGPARLTFLGAGADEDDDPTWYLSREPELTTRDVADLLRVTRATVRMWVRRGHITPIGKHGSSNVFETQSVLSAYDAIRSRTKPIPPSPLEPGWSRVRPSVNIPARYHDAVVNVREAADLAQVRPATIRSWIHRGHLKPVPAAQPREVRLRVGDVFKAARRRRLS